MTIEEEKHGIQTEPRSNAIEKSNKGNDVVIPCVVRVSEKLRKIMNKNRSPVQFKPILTQYT